MFCADSGLSTPLKRPSPFNLEMVSDQGIRKGKKECSYDYLTQRPSTFNLEMVSDHKKCT